MCEISTSNNVWSKWRTEVKILYLIASLYLQEDISPWNSRLLTAQISIPFSQCSYLQTVFISVFLQCLALFAWSRKAPLCFFVLFCFVCFRSRSYPVPHRGERVKQGTVHLRNTAIITSQNFLWRVPLYFPRLDVWFCWCFSQHFLIPHAIIWLRNNLQFKTIREIFKNSKVDVLLTVHLSIILVTDQLNAQILVL